MEWSTVSSRLEPTSYLYGAFWGVGSLYVNDTLVSNNRVIHAMATERIRSPDQQGYRLLLDNELPHRGIQAHLLLPEKVMADNGTMQEQPVPTNYTLPGGENQTFIHIIFDDPQLEGLEILDFDNATAAMAGRSTHRTAATTAPGRSSESTIPPRRQCTWPTIAQPGPSS